VLDGDIVDENTTTAQMGSVFQILSTIDSKYGIYYTYGNHDKNNYATTPNYTADQLAETIKENTKHKNQKILRLNSMQSVTKEQINSGTTYVSLSEYNLAQLKKAFSGEF